MLLEEGEIALSVNGFVGIFRVGGKWLCDDSLGTFRGGGKWLCNGFVGTFRGGWKMAL